MGTDINLNATECLARTSEVGSAIIYNICNGNRSVVPWGAGDWAMAGGLSAMFLALGLMVFAMAFRILSDRW